MILFSTHNKGRIFGSSKWKAICPYTCEVTQKRANRYFPHLCACHLLYNVWEKGQRIQIQVRYVALTSCKEISDIPA